MYEIALKGLLKPGGVGVIPTDTVYGIVARAADEAAVKRVYAIKERDAKPAPLIAASIEQLVDLGIKRRYLKAVEQYWPGPISVVTPNSIDYLNQGVGSQPIRIPDNEDLRKLLEQTGPLIASSANLASQPPANTIDEAKAYFKNNVDFYVDGGDLSEHEPSTIIRIIDDSIEVIRPGAVEIKGA
jgi:L-threonylcarbamoyladenylate synthase